MRSDAKCWGLVCRAQRTAGRLFDIQKASMPERFRIRIVGDQAQLNWDPGPANVSYYKIRFEAAANQAELVGWNAAQDLETRVLGNSITLPAMSGGYYIKAVSAFDFESDIAALATSFALSLEQRNVVETIQAHPSFLGPKDSALIVDNGSLKVVSETDFIEWADIFEVGDIFTEGGTPQQALFQLQDQIDLGAVYTSRVTAVVRGTGNLTDFSIFEWEDLFAVPDIYGSIDHEWRLKLQISTTTEDPTGVDPDWSD